MTRANAFSRIVRVAALSWGALALWLPISCRQQPPPATAPATVRGEVEIQRAVDRLAWGGDEWLTFTFKPTNRFLQFMVMEDGSLHLDLPTSSLSADERLKVIEVLAPVGATAEMVSEPVVTIEMKNRASAGRVAVDFFERVYGVPRDSELAVEFGN